MKKHMMNTFRDGLEESICHNLGCAYSYLFQMEKALEYFEKAYEAGHERKRLKTYLLAVYNIRSREIYKNTAARMGADKELLEEIEEDLVRAGHERKRLKTYLLAVYNIRSREIYKNTAARMGADKELLEEIEEDLVRLDSQTPSMTEERTSDLLLETLTEKYHRATGS